MLISLTLMVALIILSMAAAVPKVRKEIQRDQEVEAMHRGQQYVRAIQLYYRRFHNFPPNVEALQETNGIRFLRQRYSDPLTGKDDWQPILFGQNKAPTAFGFFGVLLGPGGTATAGTGGATPIGSGAGVSSPDSTSPADSTGSDSGNSSTSGIGAGLINQTFGGGGIIGFSPGSTKQSILIYKTKDHYNDWEFVYDPLADFSIRGTLIATPPPGPPVNTGSPGLNPIPSWPNPASGAPPSQVNPQ
ncbi:MAG: type II secretion system protein [Acidobacteriaceae bacterium]|nr:type II secretion system protein [Acidobacteriaceae bacterium]